MHIKKKGGKRDGETLKLFRLLAVDWKVLNLGLYLFSTLFNLLEILFLGEIMLLTCFSSETRVR